MKESLPGAGGPCRASQGRNEMFRSGYIVNPYQDWLWFLGFPFLAVLAALACFHWLSAVAVASIALWITTPHHFATWIRTYGLREDWQRWKIPLIVGPLVVVGMTYLGVLMAPTTLLLVAILWDHQHSLMQQHGLGRIYDFKAKTGMPVTGRFDLLLHCFLFINLLVTAPLFAGMWIREAYQWHLPVTPQSVHLVQMASWTATGVFLCVYVGHSLWSVWLGYPLNPLKYLFIFASYFLWYYTSWHSDSFLVFNVAHRLMPGVQYIVIVYSYLGHKIAHAQPGLHPLSWLVRSRVPLAFIGLGLLYAVGFQLLMFRPIDEFGFGLVNFMAAYQEVPPMGLGPISRQTG